MSFIKPDDVWMLWTFLIGWSAISIFLEQKYKWASAISGCIIALVGAMVFANLNIIPLDCPVYDNVWTYVVPMAVPLLLFKADIRKIWRESGRSFAAYHISAIGTVIGVIVAVIAVGKSIPEIKGIAAMFTGTYIGGSVNLAAMKDAFTVSSEMTSAAIVADNMLMAIFFFILMAIPNMLFFKKAFSHLSPASDKDSSSDKTQAASFWGRKEISLLDIAMALGVTVLIVAVSIKLSSFIQGLPLPNSLKFFLSQKYLLITTLTVILASIAPKFMNSIHGTQEIGTFFIYIFFTVIGVPASIMMILKKSPILFVFAAIIVLVNLFITLGLGKLFKYKLEELLMVSNATVGGPTTAAAMCIAKGWSELVVPALLVGVWGYVIGNYIGLYFGNSIIKMLGF